MTRLNGRVSRLEAAAPAPAEDDSHWLAELAADVLQAIDAGEIVDQTPGFQWDNFRSPTEADYLHGDERERVHSLLYRARKVVQDVAVQSGWRSPIGQADHRSWKHYRANSAGELASVMRMIVDATAN